MTEQITDTLLMIRPVKFKLNEETAVNNYFQTELIHLTEEEIQYKALSEFDGFVDKLRDHGIQVIVVDDTEDPSTPDSIFPNNWNSSHEDGSLILYPMFAENRRRERRVEILERIQHEFVVKDVIDLSIWERRELFLEGTGSLILDRVNRIAFAAVSERTSPEVMHDFARLTDYEIIQFHSYQTVSGERKPIYHTNVMMCVGERFAVICAESIDDEGERTWVLSELENSGKELILISEDQKDHFAGNMLQLRNKTGDRLIVMSQAAFESLDQDQRHQLQRHGKLVYSDLSTIETLGGGSARCMMDEIFLPKN